MNALPQRCPYCNGVTVTSAGRAICVAGPAHCRRGYDDMQQLNTDLRKVQAARARRSKYAWQRRTRSRKVS